MSLIRGIEGEGPDMEDNPETPDDLPVGALLGDPVGATLEHIVDKKHRKFTLAVYDKAKAGPLSPEDKADIVQQIYPQYTKKGALKKANELLTQKPHIQKGLELLFQGQGLSAREVAKKHAELIKFADMDEGAARAAQVRQRAIDSYWSLTVPKSIKVDVRGMSVSEIFHRSEVPKPATRELNDE